MTGMTRIWPILLCATLLPGPLMALELFGVTLESTTRDELREAVKQAGIELVREGGEDQVFDVYDSSAVMPGSSHLFLGFEPDNQGFAFVEYEFIGLDTRRLLADLSGKYGDPEVDQGRFLSDHGYRWQRDGIQIHLRVDWSNYRTRLSYVDPAALAALRAGASVVAEGEDPGTAVSLF